MTKSRVREFPWPLDEDFFVMAQEPVDWKYQVYVSAHKEFKNYNRYALVFGLQFNRNDFKLSYIKHIDDREREPYYLLSALGVNQIPYRVKKIQVSVPDGSDIDTTGNEIVEFRQRDMERYRICPYRFLLESIIESGTIYKDSFLQSRYMEIILENIARVELTGLPKSETLVEQKVNELFEHWVRFFPYISTATGMDIKRKTRTRLMSGPEAVFSAVNEDYFSRKETFLFLKLENKKKHIKNVLNGKFSDETQDNINKVLGVIPLQGKKYLKKFDSWCAYCSNREICLIDEDNLE